MYYKILISKLFSREFKYTIERLVNLLVLLCLYCIQVGSAKRVPLFLVRAIALAPPRHLILAPPRHILGQKTHHQKILPLSRIFQKIISHNYFTQCTSLLSPISSRETGDGRHKT